MPKDWEIWGGSLINEMGAAMLGAVRSEVEVAAAFDAEECCDVDNVFFALTSKMIGIVCY